MGRGLFGFGRTIEHLRQKNSAIRYEYQTRVRHVRLRFSDAVIEHGMAYDSRYCASCGFAGPVHEHHIVPRPDGGLGYPSVFLCVTCHARVHEMNYPTNHLELTMRGLAQAAAEGRKGGRRPVVSEDKLAEARSMRREGVSVRDIANRIGVSKTALYDAMRADDAG